MDNRTAAPRSTPPSTPPTSADDTPTDSGATGSEPAAPPTTSASPARPTAADVELLSFAQRFELTARDLYDLALDGAVKDTEFVNAFRTIRENHEEYANALSALLGVAAPQRRDDATFDERSAAFEGEDIDAVTDAAYQLESTAVVTHTELVGRLTGLDGAQTLSALLLVESAHCTVLASVAGKDEDLAAMLDNDASSIAPAPSEAETAAAAEATAPAATEASAAGPDETESDATETDDSTTETTEA